MRGSSIGALTRTYLHSPITEGLWHAVVEIESMLGVKLAHGIMLASLYGNPSAKLDAGNDQVHDMYVGALNTLPYLRASTRRSSSDVQDMVEEWRRRNAGLGTESGEEVTADG